MEERQSGAYRVPGGIVRAGGPAENCENLFMIGTARENRLTGINMDAPGALDISLR